jgi:putative membrane protein
MNRSEFDQTEWEELKVDEPFVRDVMAIERTIMANERTFLSFWRTALTLIIAGITFIKFFKGEVYVILGWIFIPTGVVIFIQGIRVYHRMRKAIWRAEQTVEDETKKKQVAQA